MLTRLTITVFSTAALLACGAAPEAPTPAPDANGTVPGVSAFAETGGSVQDDGNDVAFAHRINHVIGTLTDGKNLDMYWRATLCLRKIDGEWLVVHTHTPVPFDMQTGEAQIDLTP